MSIVDVLALYSIFAIWGLMFLNIMLSIGGFLYIMRMYRTDGHKAIPEYPMVTVMVPAHNESIVIQKTMEALIKLDYPRDKYEIIVVNDNSTDNSSEVLKQIQHDNPESRIIVINTDNIVGGKGKSNALNIALSVASGTVIAIYDADNTPER